MRFEADIDLAEGTFKCNCSSCTKARSWLLVVKADRFRLVAGAESQGDYQWTCRDGVLGADGLNSFCKVHGIRTPGRGELEVMGGVFYAVQVALLDDVDPDELAAAPVRPRRWPQRPF